ncbi:MAG: DUF5719 family protein [Propionibacteriaceae bacterium]
MSGLRRALWATIAIAVVGVLIGASILIPDRPARDDSLAVSGTTTLVCPQADAPATTQVGVFGVSGELAAEESGALASSVRKAVPLNVLSTWEKLNATLEISTANGGRAAGTALTSMTSGAARGLALSRCKVPATEHYFVGLQSNKTNITQIVLSNADDGEADVDVTFYSEMGRVQAAGSKSITVKAGATSTLSLESLIDQPGPIAVKVKATQGRIAAFARTHALSGSDASPRGVDWFPAVLTPRANLVIPGIPEGAGERRLVISNFGDTRAEVKIDIVGLTSTYAVADAPTMGINPEAVVSLDIAKALGGTGGSVRLTSTAPIVASVTSTSSEDTLLDVADSVSTLPIEGTAALPVPALTDVATSVSLANIDAEPAMAEIRVLDAAGQPIGAPQTATVAPGTTTFVAIPGATKNYVIEVKRVTGTVYGAVVAKADSEESKGLAVLPLTAIAAEHGTLNPNNDHRVGE